MKLLTFYLFVLCGFCFAEVHAQKVSLDVKNSAFEEVTFAVKKQTGYSFAMNKRHLQQARQVSIKADNMELDAVLEQLFKDQPFTYRVRGKIISLIDKEDNKETVTPFESILLEEVQQPIRGRVTNEKGEALVDASVVVLDRQGKPTSMQTKTDENGDFELLNLEEGTRLEISFLGYTLARIVASTEWNVVALKPTLADVEEVVVSTGYQRLPISTTTGSYAVIDSALYNRSTGPDVLSRLDHVTSGLIFNKNRYAGENSISIRGMNTIFGDSEPLIILDNYPYEGDINLINPNDVESITVLKDASSASIWGAKAGNGVIVINTKTGRIADKPVISFKTSFRFKEKPDLFYESRMLNEDYIATEQRLFEEGYYEAIELSYDNKPLSAAVELMIKLRDDPTFEELYQIEIDRLKTYDLRKDVSRYLHRTGVEQQYALSFQGGNQSQRYYLSGGFDKGLKENIGNGSERYTLNWNQELNFFGDQLKLTNRMNYAENRTSDNAPQFVINRFQPYTQLVGEDGQPTPIIYEYREPFIQQAEEDGLLGWTYNPISDIAHQDFSTTRRLFRFNPNIRAQLTKDLVIEANYQFSSVVSERRNLNQSDSYFARDFINRYSFFNSVGELVRPVPMGGILDLNDQKSIDQNWRGQLQYQKRWNDRHSVHAIVGAEQRINKSTSTTTRIYGYEEEFARGSQVEVKDYYKMYHNPNSYLRIPSPGGTYEYHDNYRSYYGNAIYTLDDKYIFSTSARMDQSNLFGVNTNQKGVPLYSLGLSWKVSDENFYPFSFLPLLKVRGSFGYNGNVNKNVSALVTAYYFDAGNSVLGVPYAEVQNPPNPSLRWEKVRVWNVGLDFAIINNVLTGSMDVFKKSGMDLIGTIPYKPSSGMLEFTGNFANTEGSGFDLTVNSHNLNGNLRWSTNFLLSHIRDKVSRYEKQTNATTIVNYAEGLMRTPIEGRPLFSIYSYRSGGLTTDTGDPIGYLEGEESQDYSAIISSTTPEDLIFHGSTRPTWFGAIRNTFSYKQVSLSFNISYSFGYYFRKQSVGYGQTYGLGTHSDYYDRWEQPGDEKLTFVPSMPDNFVTGRDPFYSNSEVLVERGDNIRLEDLRINWSPLLGKTMGRYGINNLEVYLFANKLAVLWKKNRFRLDPDYQVIPMQKQLSLGLSMNF